MSEEECYARLVTHDVGRVSGDVDRGPWALSVSYRVEGKDIVLPPWTRAALGDLRGPVTFEVDDVDLLARLGWSVVVVGRAEHVTDPAEAAAPETGGGGRPTRHRRRCVRVRPGGVTG